MAEVTTIIVPIRIESLNVILRNHWAQRHRTNTSRTLEVYAELRRARAHRTLPCTVTLTRIAPRPIDEHDNLRGGLKQVADTVALWLAVPDDNPDITWMYGQRRGEPRQYAVEIRIEARET